MDAETVVRRYLTVFETENTDELEDLVAEDVEIWTGGERVVGRRYPMSSVHTPGLSGCRTDIVELFSADDRVVVYFRNTYRHDATGVDVTMAGMKMYQVTDGRIVRSWGETDVNGLLEQVAAAGAADGGAATPG